MNSPAGPQWYPAPWRKSSSSNAGNDCVEVAAAWGDVAVRDSKDPAGPKLLFTARAWEDFALLVKACRKRP